MDLENRRKYLKYKAKYLSLLDIENFGDKDHNEQFLDLIDLKNSHKDNEKTNKEKILSEKHKIAYALSKIYEPNPSPESLPFAPNAKLSNH